MVADIGVALLAIDKAFDYREQSESHLIALFGVGWHKCPHPVGYRARTAFDPTGSAG
jgi:hypothetical protein